MKKIPKITRVKGEKWVTKYKWNLRCEETGEALDGLCDPVAKVLWIARGLADEDRFVAYEHELGHAIFYENHLREVIPINTEELIVEAFAQQRLVEEKKKAKKKVKK